MWSLKDFNVDKGKPNMLFHKCVLFRMDIDTLSWGKQLDQSGRLGKNF